MRDGAEGTQTTPLYVFNCDAGHVIERIAKYGEETRPCPACGADAHRVVVSRPYITRFESLAIENVTLSTDAKVMREQAERKGWEL